MSDPVPLVVLVMLQRALLPQLVAEEIPILVTLMVPELVVLTRLMLPEPPPLAELVTAKARARRVMPPLATLMPAKLTQLAILMVIQAVVLAPLVSVEPPVLTTLVSPQPVPLMGLVVVQVAVGERMVVDGPVPRRRPEPNVKPHPLVALGRRARTEKKRHADRGSSHGGQRNPTVNHGTPPFRPVYHTTYDPPGLPGRQGRSGPAAHTIGREGGGRMGVARRAARE